MGNPRGPFVRTFVVCPARPCPLTEDRRCGRCGTPTPGARPLRRSRAPRWCARPASAPHRILVDYQANMLHREKIG
eukprot:1058655-Prorocentrum_minimum.AAC.1